MYDYTKLTFTELVAKIGKSRFFHLPKMLEEILGRLVPQAPTYKVYTALLTQSGTDAPVATVLENTLGGDVVWSYSSIGTYNAVTNGFFTLNKTIGFFNYSLSQGDEIFMTVESIDINTIELINRTSTSSVQDVFSGQIEIRVYN